MKVAEAQLDLAASIVQPHIKTERSQTTDGSVSCDHEKELSVSSERCNRDEVLEVDTSMHISVAPPSPPSPCRPTSFHVPLVVSLSDAADDPHGGKTPRFFGQAAVPIARVLRRAVDLPSNAARLVVGAAA